MHLLLHLVGFFLLSIGAQLPPNVIVGIKRIAIDGVEFIDGDSITTYLEGSTNSLPTIYGSTLDTCDPKEKKVELVESTMRDDKKYNFTLIKGKLKVRGKPSDSVKLCLGENNKPGLNWIIVKEASVNWSLIGWTIVIVLSTVLSALFTGLNIGLMSLTLEQLEAYKNHGAGKKKKYAEEILPFRRDSNLLICTLNIANALVNILNVLGFGYIFGEVAISNVYGENALSVFCPALLTLILGEILPQAVCSKYPLQTGSWTKNVTGALLLVLYPVAKPVSFLLTLVSGKEAREVYSKEILAKLLKAHAKNTDDISKLDQGDYIIRSMARTLENLGKQAKDVMVPWEKVKKLTADDVINDEMRKKLSEMQYSRFPVIENGKVIAIQHVKDLLNVKDPRFNGLSLGIVSALWHKSYLFRTALEETPIMTLLEEMQKGIPVMLVLRSNDESRLEIVGMLTLEDLLEQVVGEIKDEKENKTKNSKVKSS